MKKVFEVARNRARGHLVLVATIACLVPTVSLKAQTLETIVSFGLENGFIPLGPMVQATDGNLYGTTVWGGHYGQPPGCGTIFRITPDRLFTTLYDFTCGADGSSPNGLIQAADGDLYGTAQYNSGTVFKVRAGELAVVYGFCSRPDCIDGGRPGTSVVQAEDRDLYGSTIIGGAYGGGSIFKVTTSGVLKTLHSFCSQSGCPDGTEPLGELVIGADGALYGTTCDGGFNNAGTVFKISSGGAFTTLHTFCLEDGCPDGSSPCSDLAVSTTGDIYGTAEYGGSQGLGALFRITPSGSFTLLHSFTGDDGSFPMAPPIQATDGNLYGTTSQGALYRGGTIYRYNPAGMFETLYNFCSQPDCTDGWYARAKLTQGTDGKFYGTTGYGGEPIGSYGTVFSFDVGLGPFVEPQIPSGKPGKLVKILGTNLTGASDVQFNGVEAEFQVASATEIVTKVPSGARTGAIQITTPLGTLLSNVPFVVVP